MQVEAKYAPTSPKSSGHQLSEKGAKYCDELRMPAKISTFGTKNILTPLSNKACSESLMMFLPSIHCTIFFLSSLALLTPRSAESEI